MLSAPVISVRGSCFIREARGQGHTAVVPCHHPKANRIFYRPLGEESASLDRWQGGLSEGGLGQGSMARLLQKQRTCLAPSSMGDHTLI